MSNVCVVVCTVHQVPWTLCSHVWWCECTHSGIFVWWCALTLESSYGGVHSHLEALYGGVHSHLEALYGGVHCHMEGILRATTHCTLLYI